MSSPSSPASPTRSLELLEDFPPRRASTPPQDNSVTDATPSASGPRRQPSLRGLGLLTNSLRDEIQTPGSARMHKISKSGRRRKKKETDDNYSTILAASSDDEVEDDDRLVSWKDEDDNVGMSGSQVGAPGDQTDDDDHKREEIAASTPSQNTAVSSTSATSFPLPALHSTVPPNPTDNDEEDTVMPHPPADISSPSEVMPGTTTEGLFRHSTSPDKLSQPTTRPQGMLLVSTLT